MAVHIQNYLFWSMNYEFLVVMNVSFIFIRIYIWNRRSLAIVALKRQHSLVSIHSIFCQSNQTN